jgi:pimeloyl-ACP methyl ester carboxylesterase
MMDDFETAEFQTGETSIFARWAGSGPPILLLHGFPQTHLMWHSVAPMLGGDRDSTRRQRFRERFSNAKQKQVNAIMTISTRPYFAERKRIVELAGKYRLPAIYPQNEFVDEGGLMSTARTMLTSIGVRLFTWTRS